MEISQFKVAGSTIQVQQGKLIVQPYCKVIGIYSCKIVSHCKHFAKYKTKNETQTLNKVINHKRNTHLLFQFIFKNLTFQLLFPWKWPFIAFSENNIAAVQSHVMLTIQHIDTQIVISQEQWKNSKTSKRQTHLGRGRTNPESHVSDCQTLHIKPKICTVCSQ